MAVGGCERYGSGVEVGRHGSGEGGRYGSRGGRLGGIAVAGRVEGMAVRGRVGGMAVEGGGLKAGWQIFALAIPC